VGQHDPMEERIWNRHNNGGEAFDKIICIRFHDLNIDVYYTVVSGV